MAAVSECKVERVLSERRCRENASVARVWLWGADFGGKGRKCRISEGTETGLPLCSNGKQVTLCGRRSGRRLYDLFFTETLFKKNKPYRKQNI